MPVRLRPVRRARLGVRPTGGRAPALNIVSIGDQLFERVASHAAARVWDLVKTVKLLGAPARLSLWPLLSVWRRRPWRVCLPCVRDVPLTIDLDMQYRT